MNEPSDRDHAEFEQRARALLEESVTHIDGRVRSRLNQARQAALAASAGSAKSPWRNRTLIPVGLATAAAISLVAVLVWQQHAPQTSPDDETDVELLADGEAFELLEDDGAFYEWAVSQEAGG